MASATASSSSDSQAENVTLHVQCHCRQQTFAFAVPRHLFPLQAETCHCDDCRQITGLLANDFLLLRKRLAHDIFDPAHPPAGLRTFSPGRVSFHFCERCGCHLLQSSPRATQQEVDAALKAGFSRHQWYASTGVLYPLTLSDELGGGRVFERTRHSWVKPGRDDSGLAHFMPDGLSRFPTHEVPGTPLTAAQIEAPQLTEAEQAAVEAASQAHSLPIRCRCGYVRLRLLRPNARPVDPQFDRHIVAVEDAERKKYKTLICPCNSCRTTMGFEGGVMIIFTDFAHIVPDTEVSDNDKDRPVPIDAPSQLQGDPLKPATVGLRTYASSDNNQRRFCPCCGSSIILDFEEHGAKVCDLFVGAIRAPFRAIASSWIVKRDKLPYLPFCRDRQLAETLRRGWCPDVVDFELSEGQLSETHGYKGELVL